MTLGQFRKLTKDMDDNTPLVSDVIIESGRSQSYGLDECPEVELIPTGEYTLTVGEESDVDVSDFEEDDDWNSTETEGVFVNTKPLLVVRGSVQELGYQ